MPLANVAIRPLPPLPPLRDTDEGIESLGLEQMHTIAICTEQRWTSLNWGVMTQILESCEFKEADLSRHRH